MGEEGGCHCQDNMAEGPNIAKMRWSQEGAVVVDMICARWGLSSLSTWVTWGVDNDIGVGWGHAPS